MNRGVSVTNANRGSNNVYDGKIAGLYDLEETLGRGHFAVVKLARHVFTGEKVAVKVIDKSKLDEVSRSHLFQEVRCMKLVQHPNVVRLYEVIDTQTKLYLILELGDGGDLYDYIMRHESGLSEKVAREYFRQIVRAISYCHRLHVVHRDLKPENVVFFEKLGVVKLTDFGFSNKFCPGQKLETSCGSLAYSAPEILLGDSYDAPAVDVWSLGVILYMLVCGQAPFQEANDSETLTMIMDCKYTIPPHVSQACKNLIGKMLIREPEKRATLAQIANDPWLAEGQLDQNVEYLPLVSKQQLTEEDHNLIIQKIVNGNIATKEEILEALDKNEYNHITATYYLLAERKLRAYRQEQIQKKRPEQLSITPQTKTNSNRNNDLLQVGNNNLPNPNLLSVPRTPGELPQRARKCSIVQEEEDEEDLSSCSGREELNTGHCLLNRRGSRSEGKLNVALQERIAESERRREALKPPVIAKKIGDTSPNKLKDEKLKLTPKKSPILSQNHTNKLAESNNLPKTVPMERNQWRLAGVKNPLGLNTLNSRSMDSATPISVSVKVVPTTNVTTTTTILNESSTISIPIHTSPNISSQVMPKYKTMPSPTRPVNSVLNSQNQLNEIFEEGDPFQAENGASKLSPRNLSSRTQTRTTNYEQRRSKFHKARTASCSSSDASDDDSENRKKRAHKINSAGKPLPGRRDSYDDSSDSQDQGGIGGSGSGGAPAASRKVGSGTTNEASQTRTNSNHSDNKTTNSNNNNNNSRKTTTQPPNFSRRHRNGGRRRTGETRLRESQSLNRITEVQEDLHSIVITTAGTLTPATQNVPSPNTQKTKSSFGARLLQGWSLVSTKKLQDDHDKSPPSTYPHHHHSRKDCNENTKCYLEEKENFKLKIVAEKSNSKKMRILGRYFQVHKKLCIPLPGIFGRGRIYKAQSCSSLARDRIQTTTTSTTATIVTNSNSITIKDRPMSEVRHSLGNKILGSDSDINQNNGGGIGVVDGENNGIVPLRSMCMGIGGGICQIHLSGGDKSKCKLC